MSAATLKRSLPMSEDTPSSSTPAQKPRLSTSTGPSIASILSVDRATLEQLPQEKLVSYVLGLEGAYRDLLAIKAKTATALTERHNGVASATASAPPALQDPKVIAAMAEKVADMMASGIKKQMKWQPSCKHKGRQFAYEAMVPSPAVFLHLFGFPEEKGAWKQKKITKEKLEEICGYLSASIRYGSLVITSPEIIVKWDREGNSFTVSGAYGL